MEERKRDTEMRNEMEDNTTNEISYLLFWYKKKSFRCL